MKVILFGASGMVGQGVLRECLLDPGVERVLTVVRRPTGQRHAKLEELVHDEFAGYDACFFCLGVSSAGMAEAAYRRVTYDITLAVAHIVVERNPRLTFIYVSGSGTDSSGRGRTMWARVKGQTENALRALPCAAAYMFRPGFIQPRHGIRSRTLAYRVLYTLVAPLVPVLRALFPRHIATTDQIGRAMLRVARHGAPRPILEPPDIIALGAVAPAMR